MHGTKNIFYEVRENKNLREVIAVIPEFCFFSQIQIFVNTGIFKVESRDVSIGSGLLL